MKYILKKYLFIVFLLIFTGYSHSSQDNTSTFNPLYLNSLLRLPIPDKVTFCNEEVPLYFEDTRERLDYEIVNIIGSPVTTTMWFKRAPRYFPEIEKYLISSKLPEDLKYVALIESNFYPRARSPAGAVGIWQFIESTGKMYGLLKNNHLDERMDFDSSTKAAISFLSEQMERFGSCFLALAAYNGGPARVKNAINEQQEESFFSLKLPRETERYVFRAIAAKIIMENPQNYGINLKDANLYKPEKFKEITLELTEKTTPLTSLTKRYGISYRYFLELNPHIINDKLPPGNYKIRVPE